MKKCFKGSQHEEGCQPLVKEIQVPLPLPVEPTFPGLHSDLATTKAIRNGQEGQRDKDGGSIQKSQCHHEPLLTAGQQRPRPLWKKHSLLQPPNRLLLPGQQAQGQSFQPSSSESSAHLPMPGTGCTIGLKPACLIEEPQAEMKEPWGCCVASEGSCGASPGLRVHVIECAHPETAGSSQGRGRRLRQHI